MQCSHNTEQNEHTFIVWPKLIFDHCFDQSIIGIYPNRSCGHRLIWYIHTEYWDTLWQRIDDHDSRSDEFQPWTRKYLDEIRLASGCTRTLLSHSYSYIKNKWMPINFRSSETIQKFGVEFPPVGYVPNVETTE